MKNRYLALTLMMPLLLILQSTMKATNNFTDTSYYNQICKYDQICKCVSRLSNLNIHRTLNTGYFLLASAQKLECEILERYDGLFCRMMLEIALQNNDFACDFLIGKRHKSIWQKYPYLDYATILSLSISQIKSKILSIDETIKELLDQKNQPIKLDSSNNINLYKSLINLLNNKKSDLFIMHSELTRMELHIINSTYYKQEQKLKQKHGSINAIALKYKISYVN